MPGDYRVGYDPDRRVYTERALAGRLRVVTPTNSVDLAAGQESLIERGSGHLQLRAIGERDDFDLWAEARDREHDRLIASRYVSPETTGIEALDDHGRWEVDSGYGAIWYPSAVAYGWAPYRYGRWAWVAPWGWTWVDDSPWGFAPFHYGRWVYVGATWCWSPGTYVRQPVYAPALVAWIGGPRLSIGISVGGGSALLCLLALSLLPLGCIQGGPVEGEVRSKYVTGMQDRLYFIIVRNVPADGEPSIVFDKSAEDALKRGFPAAGSLVVDDVTEQQLEAFYARVYYMVTIHISSGSHYYDQAYRTEREIFNKLQFGATV